MRRRATAVFIIGLLLGLISCGGGKDFSDEPLTNAQIRQGIGPVDTLHLEAVNPNLARRGERIFRDKCMKCHLLDKPNLGPPLRNVANRRSPEFIMNIILNPQENVMRHPALQKYRQQYNQLMTSQGLDSTAARAVLEYFRSVAPSD